VTRRSRTSPNVASDLVPIGRVGRPHGLDGSFFVEGPSDRADAFVKGATVYIDGAPAKIVASKRGAQNRPVIRLEQRVERGATLAVPRDSLPALEPDAYYAFQLVGLEVEEEGGRLLGRVREVLDYPANDVLELDSGVSLPLVEACVRKVDLEGGRIVIAAGFADPE
jgi:16S rRNA processing protein RimM